MNVNDESYQAYMRLIHGLDENGKKLNRDFDKDGNPVYTYTIKINK